ncbi:class I SAM-dependent methyltransferase [Pseudoxanthomonas beigongshangi]
MSTHLPSGPTDASAADTATPLAHAFAAITGERRDDALDWLARAEARGSRMAAALRRHFSETGPTSAYDAHEAFQAFIRGGDNVPLYRAVSQAMTERYCRPPMQRLLDIGTGDGMALLPALSATASKPSRIDVVEPQAGLRTALEPGCRAAAPDSEPVVHGTTLQAFVRALTPADHWDLAQSSFALQSLPPTERVEALRALRPHVETLVLVEFDVPAFAHGSDAYFHSIARRYERCLAQYGDDADLIARGFLAPMLAGQLRRDAAPSNWEQPIADWQRELERAGYRLRESRPLYDYSWSPAWWLEVSAH